MSRQRRQAGDVVVAKNGYSYTYVQNSSLKPDRILTHWLIAEKKYGRKPGPDEMVRFSDGDRRNLDPGNIIYVKKNNPVSSLKRRRQGLIDRIRELEVELEDVNRQLKEQGVEV